MLRRRASAVPAVLALVLAWLAGSGAAAAADTDLAVLKNGDRIHGEIKGLKFGRLELSTATMGTVYLEWDKVVALESPHYFEIEMTNGARYYGTLAPGDAGGLSVLLDGKATRLDVPLVVRIRPLKSSFWSRVDGAISLGASYTNSNGIGQGTMSANILTRRPRFEFSTKFDTTVTVQPDEPEELRTTWSTSYQRMLRHRWFVPGVVRLERNTDLGLALRSSIGSGVGRNLVQTNRSLLALGGGLLLNHENPVSGESTENVEAFFGATYEFFTYDTPKTTLDLGFTVFPSLNVGGRVRTEVTANLKREIIRDFTVGVTAYDSYDNKPPEGSSSSHDFGFSLSLGWTF